MITIKIFVFNPFQENTFVLHDETGECVVIDAGCYESHEKTEISNYITNNKLRCIKLIHTHCHVDHVLGNAYIASTYKPEIIAHKSDEFLINNAQKHGIVFGFNVEQPLLPDSYIDENSEIKFGNSTMQVFHVPGHSPGSVALYSLEQNFVIVGDVLFKGSIGRTDLPGGDYDMLINSISKSEK